MPDGSVPVMPDGSIPVMPGGSILVMPDLIGHLEPGVAGGEEVQDVEHHGPGGAGAGETGHAVTVGIPGPDANGVLRRHAHGPRVAEPVAGAGLPRGLPHGPDEPPVQFIGPVHLLQRLQGVPHRQGIRPEHRKHLRGARGALGTGYAHG